jgi:hypothetical protein
LKLRSLISLFLLLSPAVGQEVWLKAAARYVPGVHLRAKSVVLEDFTCSGHKQQAILGTNSTEIAVAVFIRVMDARPEVLRYSAKARNPAHVILKAEDLDYDPKEDPGYELPGFQRSKSCNGLNLSDEDTDSAHIYWNHIAREFDDWVR